MKTIVVGDPHGCIEEFEELLKLSGYKHGEDKLVIAGDVFDRGPDSVGVLHRIMELGATLVLGNHDEKHLRYAIHEDQKRSKPNYKNPMQPFTGQRLLIQNALTKADLDFLKAAPIILRLSKKWVVVHAGMENKPLDKQGKAVLRVRYVDKDTGEMASLPHTWNQPPNSVYWTDLWKGPESVLYGHAVHSLESPRYTFDHRTDETVITVGLDTGCCFGGKLTAAVLEDDKILWCPSVKAKKVYKPMTKDSHKE